MKYEQTKIWFRLPDGRVVQPCNGEKLDTPQVSWSHGFTHFKTESGNYGFCGINWFEKNAIRI